VVRQPESFCWISIMRVSRSISSSSSRLEIVGEEQSVLALLAEAAQRCPRALRRDREAQVYSLHRRNVVDVGDAAQFL
jgi:hypothetical protein